MKRFLPLLLCVLLVSGCAPKNKKSKRASSVDEEISENSNSEIISTPSEIVPSQGTISQSNSNPISSSQDTNILSTISSASSKSNTSTQSSTSKPSSSSVDPSGNTYIKFSDYPSISLRKFLAPTNTPHELITHLSEHHWWENSMKDEMPNDDWTYIYGNKTSRGDYGDDRASPRFYSSNNDAPGGLRMDQKWLGFQTELFHHTGEKLEIRMKISQVNNAGNNPETTLPIGFFLFYDKNANYLENLTHVVERGQITANTDEVKFYVTGSGTSSIAYFEFRLVALASKNQQKYNFGIGEINVNSWEKA